MLRVFSGIVLLVFLAVVFVFAIQNLPSVPVQFLTWRGNFPLASLIVGAYVLGMLSGWSVLGFIRKSIHRVREPVDR
jgi:uncharacterized integral membrane protein